VVHDEGDGVVVVVVEGGRGGSGADRLDHGPGSGDRLPGGERRPHRAQARDRADEDRRHRDRVRRARQGGDAGRPGPVVHGLVLGRGGDG